MTTPEWFARKLGPGGLEMRSLPVASGGVEARAASDTAGPMIAGLGSVSGVTTLIDDGYDAYTEEIVAGAWANTVKTGDIRSMMNHDTNWLLGRTKSGTLRVTETDQGLPYEIDINPADDNAMAVHARVARGDIDGSSVWFRVISQTWTFPTDTNGLEVPHRQITEAQLYEVGPVVFPAYETTTAAARALLPLDGALRSLGVSTAKRASLAVGLLTDPDEIGDELRSILRRSPELREAVCSCDTRSGPADATSPAEDTRADVASPDLTLSMARRRAWLLDRV